jgi:hypothetical protein
MAVAAAVSRTRSGAPAARASLVNTSRQGEAVARTTFQKRQKEMKRLEKQRMKAERRQQRKLAKSAEPQAPVEIESEPVEPAPQAETNSECGHSRRSFRDSR